MGSSFTCKLNPCCGDMRNCDPPPQYSDRYRDEPVALSKDTSRFNTLSSVDDETTPGTRRGGAVASSETARLVRASQWLQDRWSQKHPNTAHIRQLADYEAFLSAIPAP